MRGLCRICAFATLAAALTTAGACGRAEWSVTVQPLPSPAGPDSSEPQLTGADDNLVLSWIDRSGSLTHLKFSRRTSTGWTPAVTAASGRTVVRKLRRRAVGDPPLRRDAGRTMARGDRPAARSLRPPVVLLEGRGQDGGPPRSCRTMTARKPSTALRRWSTCPVAASASCGWTAGPASSSPMVRTAAR